jgi:predicted nucleic acid-binding protein
MSLFFDTGVFYALLDRGDDLHPDASAINFHAQKRKWGALYTSNYVTLETTLLLKARLGWKAARALPGVMRRLGVRELMVDEETHRKALESFESGGRELSLTDAATSILTDILKVRTIATFDRRSFGGSRLEVVGTGYAGTLSPEESKEVRSLED